MAPEQGDLADLFHLVRRRLNGLTLQLEVASIQTDDPASVSAAVGTCKSELRELVIALDTIERLALGDGVAS